MEKKSLNNVDVGAFSSMGGGRYLCVLVGVLGPDKIEWLEDALGAKEGVRGRPCGGIADLG